MLKYTKTLFPELQLQSLKFIKMKSSPQSESTQQLIREICKYEKSQIATNYKFGLIYVKDGQISENDWLSNCK